MGEIKEKIAYIKSSSSHLFRKDNWSFYRIFIFLTSARGQKRLLNVIWKIIRYFFRKITGFDPEKYSPYEIWMKKNFPTEERLRQYGGEAKKFEYQPKISILLPVYDPPEDFFKQAIDSVIKQVYTNWELCIADDLSPNKNIKTIIKEYAKTDDRIKYVFREENGHISACSNSALALATGDYVALLDHDDLLSLDALYQNVKVLNQDKSIDLLYSDEDKIDENNTHVHPNFKPDWAPDNLLSRNYICHFVVARTELIKSVGGFRLGFEGSQDYDLLLRITEKTDKIYHHAKMLYHWRIHSKSTADDISAKPYVFDAGIKAIEEALERRKTPGTVSLIEGTTGFYSVRYKIAKPEKVSVIIPTKDRAALTDVCISSVFNLTDYPDFEVVLMNNNSAEDSFFEMVKKWEEKEPNRFKCVVDNGDFNFSRLMNNSAKESDGTYLLLLNNDTEVTHADWMTAMVEQAQHKSIGAVGAKLVFENDTIQHAGVIIGLGGIAGHTFVGATRDATVYYNYLKIVNNYSAVTAACLMVRKEVYDEVGGFEESLAVEFNDVDFCLKLKEKGYNNIYLPHVDLYHYESISRGHPHKTKAAYKRHLKEVGSFKVKWQKYIDHDPCYNEHLSLLFTDFRLKNNEKVL